MLAKYGLADWVSDSTPGFIRRRFVTAEGAAVGDFPVEVRIRLALTELGTTFIKLGQMMSTRADMVGPELAEELASLQADTPADPPDVVRATIQAELGYPPEELFAWFEPTALASASVGQVHAARLFDGTEVVVKVQHAGIEEKVRSDLSLMATVAGLAESNSKELARYRPSDTVDEFARSLMRELNFHTELNNLLHFAHNFADNPRVHLPTAYPELSSRRVLTMERLDGFSIADSARMDAAGVDRLAFANLFANTMMQMIFRDGFYHADPHPGNIFALPPEPRLGMLDCGKVGRVDEQTRDDFIGIVASFLSADVESLTDQLIELCEVPIDLNRSAYRSDVADFVGEFRDTMGGNLDIGAAFESMFAIIRKHHLVVPPRVNMLLLVIVQTEGTARQLDPEFDLTATLKSYGTDLLKRRFSPQQLQREAVRSFRDWSRLLKALPRETVNLLERTQRGELQIHVQQHGMQRPLDRLTYGIVVAAILLGSALMWAFAAPPVIFGISIIGALGVALGLALAAHLLYLVWRA
ncbi:MAG: AarF/ABC1/UbiB kinase family protein [Caldilinea sp.]|nr:AarF/ABC1/UbiB kinase family protein [Caldilineaceae bacterium]MCB9119552.1 AarF/ABC1/UbiB kinase family protein [Caldilineaceae bacterium]MCB9124909.1 AarF/ABC1/UbiB kinase family protein [Caldilineaceae bacterium]MCO5213563.1 AarF/ABC1/UbiB kinase family protein [Caldilinea sp.]MCW5842391.1 AarF/ABC1/UbiB kinase family protein [Caldilinea sp.]